MSIKRPENHYQYLDRVMPNFLAVMEVRGGWDANCGIVGAHGDKCYQYREKWEAAGIPFKKGAAVYLLTYCAPYEKEVRDTATGWVAPADWVVENFKNFEKFLPE